MGAPVSLRQVGALVVGRLKRLVNREGLRTREAGRKRGVVLYGAPHKGSGKKVSLQQVGESVKGVSPRALVESKQVESRTVDRKMEVHC